MQLTLSQKLHKDRDKFLFFCTQARHVRIFGSGDTAILIYRYLEDEQIPVLDFIVPDADYVKDTFYGRPMRKLSEVHFSPDDGLILAVEMWMQGLVIQNLINRPDYPFAILPQTVYGQYSDLLQEPGAILPGYTGNDAPTGYFSTFTELNSIGESCGTDKSSRVHNYLNKYEFFLQRWKEKEFTLLELGVFDGDSVRMWRDYFQKANVVGVDIDERCLQEQGDRIEILIGDLSLTDTLESLKTYQPAIIIDDASHIWSHQIKSLCTLFSILPHGGIFILEDLETSFSAYRFNNYDDASVSAYTFLSMIAEVVTSCEHLSSNSKPAIIALLQQEIEDIAMQVEMISFIKGSCVLVKK